MRYAVLLYLTKRITNKYKIKSTSIDAPYSDLERW